MIFLDVKRCFPSRGHFGSSQNGFKCIYFIQSLRAFRRAVDDNWWFEILIFCSPARCIATHRNNVAANETGRGMHMWSVWWCFEISARKSTASVIRQPPATSSQRSASLSIVFFIDLEARRGSLGFSMCRFRMLYRGRFWCPEATQQPSGRWEGALSAQRSSYRTSRVS